MIKGELYRIGKYAMELYAMAEELEETGQEIDFPSWWQSMITDSASKMVKAKHYLDFELKEPAIDAAVDKLTGEKPHIGEPDYSDVTEGFLDRMKASVKGAVAGVGKDTTTPPVDENMFTGRNPYNMGSSDSDDFVGDDISIDILAGKIAKALKNPENQNEDDQNNIKQARKALNLGDVEVAKKIAKPYITEKIAKQLKEDPKQNYPEELDGEYEGKPQKIKGADIYDTLKDILDISNSENDFIRKMTDSLTDETSVLSKSSEEKLRNWYKKNVTN